MVLIMLVMSLMTHLKMQEFFLELILNLTYILKLGGHSVRTHFIQVKEFHLKLLFFEVYEKLDLEF